MTPSLSLSSIGIEDEAFMRHADGFTGVIKRHPDDFTVQEIDASGKVADVSTFAVPVPTPTLDTERRCTSEACAPARDDSSDVHNNGIRHGDDWASNICFVEQLRQIVGADDVARLAALDSAGRKYANTSAHEEEPHRSETSQHNSPSGHSDRADGIDLTKLRGEASLHQKGNNPCHVTHEHVDSQVRWETPMPDKVSVLIAGAQGSSKAKRARVHSAIQEVFPFVRTTTQRGPGEGVSVVCSSVEVPPALRELVSESELECIQRMVNRGPLADTAGAGVKLSLDEDREHRSKVHRAIADVFPFLRTKTDTDPRQGFGPQISIFWKSRKGAQKRKRQYSDDSRYENSGKVGRADGAGAACGGQTHVRFWLRKEGREHHRVAAALAKVLNVRMGNLSFAGIKDKRAITTQACVVKGVPPEEILRSNGSIVGVTVGNLAFCDRGLSLLRSVVQDAATHGFINFFGTQRVGLPSAATKGSILSHQIGRDIFRGDWQAAVRKILQPRATDPPALRSALSDLLDSRITPKECLTRLPGKNRLSQEKLVLQGLVRYGASAYQKAVECVSHGMRTMWAHAYQSYVWNIMASARIRLLGRRAVPGDLFLHHDRALDSSTGTRTLEEGSGRVGAAVGAGKDPGTGEGGAEQSETSAPKFSSAVRVLTATDIEAYASEGVTPEDLLRRVVLPLPGKAVGYPTHEIGTMYKQHLEEDQIDVLRADYHTSNTSSVTEGDSARESRINFKAGVPWNEPALAYGVAGTVSMLEEKREHDGEGIAAKLTPSWLTVRGAYRRVLCVPEDLAWRDAAITDCRGKTTEPRGDAGAEACGSRSILAPGSSTRDGTHGREAPMSGADEAVEDAVVKDVLLTFTLPPGSFATMLLREVMKRNEDVAWSGEREDKEDKHGVDLA